MNKYMGFYELKAISLPTVPWKLFTADEVLDGSLLWTVRVAVEGCNDLNLPRAVGVQAEEAFQKGMELLEEYAGKGIVVYYPYFIAQKSGVLDISCHRTIVEAVDKDLWNLVTHGRRNVTVIFTSSLQDEGGRQGEECNGGAEGRKPSWVAGVDDVQYFGDEAFLERNEIDELLKCSAVIRGRFREKLSEGKSILAEWSYAFNTDIRHEPLGARYLVFYELRGL